MYISGLKFKGLNYFFSGQAGGINGKVQPKYDRIILLIRDPFDTLLAEYNRRNSHRSSFSVLNFGSCPI